jgi:putative oxidoreductase
MNNERTVPEYPLTVDVSLLLVRVIVGVIFAAHGSQKVFGAFDGPGLSAMMGPPGPPPNPGMGPVLGFLVSIGECFGGLGLIVGFLTRFSAASLIVIMIGAIAMVHGRNGLLLQNGGFEYNLALIGLLLPIFLCGAGRFSLGRYLPLPKAAGTRRPMMLLE